MLEINEAARGALEWYVRQKAPGFALLIEAPWGAGKTHFVRRELHVPENKEVLYVSLYGVSTAEEFEWCLVRARQPWLDTRYGKWIKKLGGGFKGLSLFGVNFDPGKVGLAEFALSSLPDVLVFDDLERSDLTRNQMFGSINRFIEHQGKNVVLIANSEKLFCESASSDPFDKVIGRRVAIDVEVDEALQTLWAEMPEKPSVKYLMRHQADISTIFREAAHGNLRLLRQAILSVLWFLDQIDEELYEYKATFRRLVREYVALSMAYSSNLITINDLEHRDAYPGLKNEHYPNLEVLAARHPDCARSNYTNQVFPAQISAEVIGRGYASREEINRALRSTHHFTPKPQTPDWVRLWNWEVESASDLELLIQGVFEKMEAESIVSPGEILQLFGAMRFLADFEALDVKKEDLLGLFVDYIDRIGSKGRFPEKSIYFSERDEDYGYGIHGDTVGYGGYCFQIDDSVVTLIEKLKGYQDVRLESRLEEEARSLEVGIRRNTIDVLNDIDSDDVNAKFYMCPILNKVNVKDFCNIIVEKHMCDDPSLKDLVRCLSRRRNNAPSRFPEEVRWFQELSSELLDCATGLPRLKAAQIRLMIRREFKSDGS